MADRDDISDDGTQPEHTGPRRIVAEADWIVTGDPTKAAHEALALTALALTGATVPDAGEHVTRTGQPLKPSCDLDGGRVIGEAIVKASATHLSRIRAHVKAGELTLALHLGDQVIAAGHRITTTPTDIVLDPPIPARLADQIRPVLTNCTVEHANVVLAVITEDGSDQQGRDDG